MSVKSDETVMYLPDRDYLEIRVNEVLEFSNIPKHPAFQQKLRKLVRSYVLTYERWLDVAVDSPEVSKKFKLLHEAAELKLAKFEANITATGTTTQGD